MIGSKSLQVSKSLLSNLADLHNAIVLMITALSLISSSSKPFNKSLGTVIRTLIIIVFTNNFLFYSFFISQAMSVFFSLIFKLWFAKTFKSTK